jgi:MFS family permease
MNSLQHLLNRSRIFFIIWSMLAAFGTYFCMYAFRKPFNAGTYSGLELWGMDYKIILIIAQVFGYMLSKFIGIKVISELKPAQRKVLIIGLILFAEISLVFFGLVPFPYNFAFLFLNGLPLGMVWGIVFSYLEGRRFTEVLSMGLCISLIVSSGFLKTIYFAVHGWFPAVSEFWMPAFIGLLFLPLFLFFVWMLSAMPKPTENDKLLRVERLPMTPADKRFVLKKYGWGILCILLLYTMLATMRDFRDNFSVEIWNDIGPSWNKSVFSETESITGMIVLISIACLSIIRSNLKGFWATLWLMSSGLILCGMSTFLFHIHYLSPFWWMSFVGMGMFLAYTPVQVALFERMIALFRIRANAGFFVYLCDSIGYLGSVLLLLYKEFFMRNLSWAKTLMWFSYLLTGVGLLLLILSALFFARKSGSKRTVAETFEKWQSV